MSEKIGEDIHITVRVVTKPWQRAVYRKLNNLETFSVKCVRIILLQKDVFIYIYTHRVFKKCIQNLNDL